MSTWSLQNDSGNEVSPREVFDQIQALQATVNEIAKRQAILISDKQQTDNHPGMTQEGLKLEQTKVTSKKVMPTALMVILIILGALTLGPIFVYSLVIYMKWAFKWFLYFIHHV